MQEEKKSRICLKMLANTPDAHSVCVCVCVCAPVAAGVHGNKDEVGGLTCLDREADCLNSLAEWMTDWLRNNIDSYVEWER